MVQLLIDHQPIAVLPQRMTQVGVQRLRVLALALAIQRSMRIGTARVGVVVAGDDPAADTPPVLRRRAGAEPPLRAAVIAVTELALNPPEPAAESIHRRAPAARGHCWQASW